MDYRQSVIDHHSKVWNNTPVVKYFGRGPIEMLPKGFCVLEFAPQNDQNMWIYSTCCMSSIMDENPIELHIYSPKQSPETIEILYAITHFHFTASKLNLNHTVNFGKPWMENSNCQYGLISYPYIDKRELESLQIENKIVKFYWLIPITKQERDFKIEHGIEALEMKFEASNLNYTDFKRESIV